MQGNLYKLTAMRIPAGQNYDDPISAVNGNVEGEKFHVSIVHTEKDDDSYYYVFKDGAVIIEGTDLDDVGNKVIDKIQEKLSVTDDDALNDLGQIVCMQDDADYDLDEDYWTFTVGNIGEVVADDRFNNGLLINLTPFYDTTINEAGECDDDDASEDHEFCGARTISI